MSRYVKLNLFVTAAHHLVDGQVRHTLGRPIILRGSIDEAGWRETSHGDPWLMISIGSFWPVMLRLDPRDIEHLREGLARL